MTDSYRSPQGGCEYSVGEIFGHREPLGVYARVSSFDREEDAVVFSVWDVRRPGWHVCAKLETPEFAKIYTKGPYAQGAVDQVTEHYQWAIGRCVQEGS